MNRILTKGAFIGLFCVFAFFNLNAANRVASVSGNWNSTATWGGAALPTNADNVRITGGVTVTHTNNVTVVNVRIDANGTLVSTGRLTLSGSYINNGSHSCADRVTLQGTNTVINGAGTISGAGQFRVNNDRTIAAAANLSFSSGVLRIANNTTLTNAGIVTLTGASILGQGNGSTFINGNGSTLNVQGTLMTGGVFTASANNNTVVYNATGATSQAMRITSSGYFNLTIDGDNSLSEKTLVENTIVAGNFSVTGSTFTHTNAFTLSVAQNISVSSGSGVFKDMGGLTTLNGSTAQTIALGDVELNDLQISNTLGGVSIVSDTVRIGGTLTVTSGVLTTNGRLVIESKGIGDGSIGPITGGSISGDVRNMRYIDQGATNWRFMCSPTTNATFNSWKDDFITAGFPGSHFPNFHFASILAYDETAAGISDSGFFEISITDNITPGKAFWVYCGDSLQGTNPFTIDVLGPINQGNFDFNPTFTTQFDTANDGWNLLGNPYPSAINWDSPNWTKTNIDDAIYMWNTDLNQYASFVAGLGTNGGNNIIPMGHGFYVHANNAGPQLIVQETAKIDTTVPFLREERIEDLVVSLTISQAGMTNQTAVRIIPQSTKRYDAKFDAYYLPSIGGNNTALYSKVGEQLYSIQSLPITANDTIWLASKALIGSASIHYTVEEISGDFCVILWDRETNEQRSIENTGEYNFINSNASDHDRFALVIRRNTSGESSFCDELLTVNDINNIPAQSLGYVADGFIKLYQPELHQNSHFAIYSLDGKQLKSGQMSGADISIESLAAGIYILSCDNEWMRFVTLK